MFSSINWKIQRLGEERLFTILENHKILTKCVSIYVPVLLQGLAEDKANINRMTGMLYDIFQQFRSKTKLFQSLHYASKVKWLLSFGHIILYVLCILKIFQKSWVMEKPRAEICSPEKTEGKKTKTLLHSHRDDWVKTIRDFISKDSSAPQYLWCCLSWFILVIISWWFFTTQSVIMRTQRNRSKFFNEIWRPPCCIWRSLVWWSCNILCHLHF